MQCFAVLLAVVSAAMLYFKDLLFMQAIDFKRALGCKGVGVLDLGAGSGLLSMMAARYGTSYPTLVQSCTRVGF